ncbi:hypothetical protein FGO68_gene76 [Halteria grandinella]|uniref:Uncharacterized protein n=1 Tax=Halteria grandinella TaxID=5974 RepID=A0A8J8P4M1_HALGN|nr:hypothetical protein FGO68_gene76 [Halteria grandinella]
MKAQGLFDSKVETFNKYMLSYMLSTIPGSGNYFKFLTKVRTYFDKEAVEQLINTYTWTVQQLNMEASHTSDIALDALYSVFQLSNLEGMDVFKHYRDADMIMMNVNSILFKDVVTLQQSIDGVQINNFMAKKMAELRPRYFQLKNFRSAFIKEYKDFINAFNQKKAFISDKHTASSYIIDMDSQFIMVPKNWVTKLIIIKLLSLCISLANELRNISHEDYKEEEEEAGAVEESKHPQTFEKQLEKRLKEIQTIQRVNMLSLDTQKIQEKYAEAIERIDAKQMQQLCKNPEFDALVQSYRQKIMFNSIKFNSVTNSAAKYLHSPLNFIGAELYLNFDFGILYKKQKIIEINEILNFAINSFKGSISLEGFEVTSSQDDEDDLRTIQMKYRLQMLIKSFAAFILADEYEIMVELIKGELKIYKKREQTQSVKDVVWILSKFMLALDIHYYMRCGSIKSASKTTLDFLNAFSKYLTYQEKIKLLSSTFFMVFVGKAGQGYIPDYGMSFLDFGYNFDQYYGGRGNMGADVLSHGDNCDFLNGETPPIEDEEREIIKKEYEGQTIELVADEELYINILNQIIKQLDLINKDERSAFYKSQYIQIFNILMTVAVNDQKKSSKIIDILSKGFELICNSSYDEYFQHQGLTEFNYSNAQGFNELFKQFKECEDEYKHQFFANARFGGYQLVHIDVKKSQTKEAQAKIAQAIDKNFFREVKKVASHIYLGQLLKKKLRTRRQHYQAIRRAKSTYIFEERQMAELLGLKEMLVIEQLPSKAILELLQQIQKKEACLRQLIVCKFAVNSLDTHYILAKATELNQVYQELLDKSKSYIAEKGKILFEFLDVENEQDELADSITKAKLRFIEIDNDVGTWMTQKAEPNLVEVERKNTKYKIKWESMKIYDKRLKIKALQAKGREITAK